MSRKLYARPSRSHKPHQGNKHPGIYGNGKDIQPAPQCTYVSARFALPIGHTLYLQEKYPGMTLNMAIKAYLLENIPPVDVKEI